MSEPVRAQLIRSSVAVTRKPLSASSLLSVTKDASSAPTGRPVRGSRMPVAGGAITLMGKASIPFERPLPPFIDKADRQDRKEYHHGPEAEQAELAEGHRPGKQERHFQVENDEQYGDEVEPHVELHARIVERIEAAFVGRQLFRVGLLIGEQKRGNHQGEADDTGDADEHD